MACTDIHPTRSLVRAYLQLRLYSGIDDNQSPQVPTHNETHLRDGLLKLQSKGTGRVGYRVRSLVRSLQGWLKQQSMT
jgi:hypothetical protein